MKDFSDDFAALRKRLDEANGYLKIDSARERLAQLETEAGRPDLWDDQERARAVTSAMASLRDDVTLYDSLVSRLSDASTLWELAVEESDDSLESEIADAVAQLVRTFDDLELRSLFTGEHDES